MLCSRILVAYDGSDLGKKALEKAVELAKVDPLIDLEIIHVVHHQPQAVVEFASIDYNFRELALQHGKETLEEAQDIVAPLSNKTTTYLKEGLPAAEILEHARVYSCDLIIMGSRGLSGIKELFLGSVSHNVIQRSPVPVFVVK